MATRVIVDEGDNVIREASRDDFDPSKEIYRVSALWLTNSKGETLLAQPPFSKINGPGQWGPAVAGAVEQGETYFSNITKETKEEIGQEHVHFIEGLKTFWNGPRRFFCQWYSAEIDKPAQDFKIQVDEVNQVAWIDLATLNQEIEANPDKYISSMKDVPQIYLQGE